MSHSIFTTDADDESLRRYKASLLGAAATGVPKTEDPRQVLWNAFFCFMLRFGLAALMQQLVGDRSPSAGRAH